MFIFNIGPISDYECIHFRSSAKMIKCSVPFLLQLAEHSVLCMDSLIIHDENIAKQELVLQKGSPGEH